MAARAMRPSLYMSMASTGHFWEHMPHPVHSSSSTRLGFFVSVTVKFPTSPSTDDKSALVTISMFSCRPTSTSFGAMMHIEQSLVGKVLSSWAMAPPMVGLLSTRYTLKPDSARSREDCIPEMPPPTTITAPTLSLAVILETSHGLVVGVVPFDLCELEGVPLP